MEIDLLGDLHHHAMHHEVGTVDELRDGLRAVVAAAILRPHLIVDGILGLFDVQLTGIAVGILTAEVIDAVGDIARLLYLGQEVAGTNGVQTACRRRPAWGSDRLLAQRWPVARSPRG